MSNQTKGSSSSAPGGARSRRRRGEKQRGIPQLCRCGEEAVIRTSGTTKNPGRLFYCCPKGSEEVDDFPPIAFISGCMLMLPHS
ncbi:hypothetical protein F2Q69_00028808 [Brassica cretica]|uniref:GRF-type domain-containing protein n=1 Tax=Brassica cretica TaxID=69181 RepID=A0A8S9S5T7_BRACR|nr:hypothetical protein F2Q69_00028808 [Brassica cretica]